MFYFGRGPRRGGGGGFFGLIFLIFFFPVLFDLIDLGIGLIAYLLPLALIGIAGYTIYKVIKSLIDRKKTNTSNKTQYTKKKQTSSGISNADYTKIDKKLTSYFSKNVSLPVINGISLVTQNGKYTSIDQLYITYKDEKVVKLAEFKEDYPEMYNKIFSLLLAFSKQPDTVMAQEVNTEKTKRGEALSDAQKYIDKISSLNAQIPQEEITNGLYQTCDLLNKIEKSKQSKQDEQKLNKLYDYYLPILTGILENYKQLQDNAIKGDEFKKCEAQLIKTIMLINQTLKTLYSGMHEDDYLNINADINTLQTLLQKDGYGEDPFATKEKK